MKMRTLQSLFLISACFLSVSCGQVSTPPALRIAKTDSLLCGGKPVGLFRLTNKNGMTVEVTNYGASLVSVSAPDRNGVFEPVVLGLDSLRHYLEKQPKLGATVGRYANRIKGAEFTLDNEVCHLDRNSRMNTVHGGFRGFHLQVFKVDTSYVVQDTAVIVFKYFSPDLEGGFPGNLNLSLAYKLTNANEVVLEYEARTDKPTVVNFTNHSYFNLTGCKGNVLNHRYKIEADSITPVDSLGVPTGELKAVAGTAYDFSTMRTAAERIGELNKGYDINYKLDKQPGVLTLAATVTEPVSGRVLKAYTTEPGMQFYIPAANLDYLKGQGCRVYGKYYGFCLEMQHFPDSPHHAHFPTTVLRPGEVYRQTTVYKFETASPATEP